MTINKAQGQTLATRACVYARTTLYVAFSSVRTLDSIHVKMTHIFCSFRFQSSIHSEEASVFTKVGFLLQEPIVMCSSESSEEIAQDFTMENSVTTTLIPTSNLMLFVRTILRRGIPVLVLQGAKFAERKLIHRSIGRLSRQNKRQNLTPSIDRRRKLAALGSVTKPQHQLWQTEKRQIETMVSG
ncbi:hypothetical protein LAZ67_10000864 [Cordylochernes scorpioides]|uniref:Uncharacterized protein n=1 Tax=Cordylochernes scorpioides TaxID=51811 RepID=A0ABY6KY48_9ARAC|nr:hypothetical protein LAZ67_10000864 [Cordylochernes scorpioides]